MVTTEGAMKLTIHITPRRWWQRLGLFGMLIVYLGLKCGAPLKAFFRIDV